MAVMFHEIFYRHAPFLNEKQPLMLLFPRLRICGGWVCRIDRSTFGINPSLAEHILCGIMESHIYILLNIAEGSIPCHLN